MLELLTDATNLPFAVALVLMLLLALLQITGIGHLFGDHDADVDVDGDLDFNSGLMSFLGFGRIPMMMWLMLLLTVFGLIGISGQQLITKLLGAPFSPWLAAPLAAIVALPITGMIARPLGAIMPRDETTAVSLDTLVGREGVITIGVASPGHPARAKVKDAYGLDHYVMVEPDNHDQRFGEGERVLLVRREGDLFKAITRGDHLLPRLD